MCSTPVDAGVVDFGVSQFFNCDLVTGLPILIVCPACGSSEADDTWFLEVCLFSFGSGSGLLLTLLSLLGNGVYLGLLLEKKLENTCSCVL